MSTTTTDLRRQHQAILDANGPVPGDCWRTALACLLEVPRDEVPHFIHAHNNEPGEWWLSSVAWVEHQRPGYTLAAWDPRWPIIQWDGIEPEDAPQWAILTGKSPRGDWQHCVIASARTGQILHDPHPAGGGLRSQDDVAVVVRKEWV
ncbi:MAG: hypothetical protein K0Q52_2319 [Microbacterium sp.]|jgi:hypothetical protein|nr:hypothetical protein [Microbacterium sp.]